MIGLMKTFSSIAVDDVSAANRFYRESVGLDVTADERGVLWLRIGEDNAVLVYPKPGHEPATYTVLNFMVEDIGTAVDELAATGVKMLRYDGFPTDDRGIHHTSARSIAWFADPAGNVLSVAQER